MKKLLFVLLASTLPLAVHAAEPAKESEQAAKPQQQSEGRFKGALFDALRSLSGMLPRQDGHKDANGQATATMGIRGAENTASLMKPYWKDDKNSDPAFKAQVEEYGKAQLLLEQGKLPEAEAAMNTFIQQHPQSELLPNARFGLALAYAGQGQRDKGRIAMNNFLKEDPKHPLAADAQKVLAELK